jgi:hypothetical protein
MIDRMPQAGALLPDVTTTLADFGGNKMNQEQMTGAGHNGIASMT